MGSFLKKYGAYLAAALIFIGVALAYCLPALSGKVLRQGDVYQWKGMTQELSEYNAGADVPANWTNSMFSGMPGYQISYYAPKNAATWLVETLDQAVRGLMNSTIALLVLYFLGFFIMMRGFGVGKWMSIVGSLAVSMSSYFFLIIPAGHVTKAMTLGILGAVIGGFSLIFRGRRFAGGVAVMFFSSLALLRHPQMSYYIFLMLGLFGIAEIVIHVRQKRLKDLFISLAVFVAALGIGVGTGYSNLKSNSEYLRESTRGMGSELDPGSSESSGGLDFEYATAWSYGIGETLTLMVPNAMGGSSNYDLGDRSKLYKVLVDNGLSRKNARSFVSSLPTYWGEQPFTAGPVYAGAIVCLLFILGCLIVKGPYKWALIASTLFSILLSWGHNFEGFSRLFFNWFPLYNKFRTVSSILVVAEISMPLLGFLGLKTIADAKAAGKDVKALYSRPLIVSTAVTGGICLLCALIGPSLLSFSSSMDARNLGGLPEWFVIALQDERAAMFAMDSWRSLIFILLTFAILFLHIGGKLKTAYYTAALGVLVVADMWPVNKRFFPDSDWVSKADYGSYFDIQPYERQILADGGYSRVLNLSSNTFNESRTSYRLHSVGGYHAAKLRRYQDLIDRHISSMNMNVLNMLNTKYVIQDENGVPTPFVNPDHLGNAWFVNSVEVVDGAKMESDALDVIDPAVQAVTDRKFESFVLPASDADGSIELLSYAPDRLEYRAVAEETKTAVFSEIYYPYGWKAYIDGKKVEHFRVNYVLRALNVPAGEHEIVFEFRPDSVYKGILVDAACKSVVYLLILLLVAGLVCREIGKGPKWLRSLGLK